MSLQSWVLFDESNPLTPRSDRLPESHATRRGTIHTAWTQLKHGPGAGVDLLDITGTNTGFTIVPTRGMGIWRAKDAQHDYGWDSPVHGPVHPDRVPVTDPSGLGWLEGFDELLVRCGLSSNGAPEFDAQNKLVWPLHGRIANIPARRVTVTLNSDEGWIEVEGEVRESKLFFANLVLTSRMRFYADGHRLEIRDEVMNAGAQTAIHQLLYHINFGSPVLESGAKLLVAAEKVVPRNARAVEGIDTWSTYLGPTTGYAEQVYFFKPRQDVNGWSKAAVVNAAGSLGVGSNLVRRRCPGLFSGRIPPQRQTVTLLASNLRPIFPTCARLRKSMVAWCA